MKGLLKQIEEASTSIFGDDLSERVVLAERELHPCLRRRYASDSQVL